MPSIPVYQQQTQAGGSLRVQADASAFGAPMAQAGARIGEALGNIATQEQRLVSEQNERDARAWSGQAVSGAMLDWTKNLQERQQSALPGAPDFTPGVLKDFDDYSAKLIDSAPTPAAKDFARQHMTAMRTQIGEQALRFEAGARVTLRLDQATTAITNSAQVVQQDPWKYSTMAALLRQTMPDVGPEHAQQLNTKMLHDLQEAAASNALENAPRDLVAKTEHALGVGGATGKTGVPWIDEATPAQVKAWNQQADARVKQLDAGKLRDQDAANKLAVDAVNKLRGFVTDGQMPRQDYQDEVRMLTKGTPWEQEANQLIEAGVKGAGFGAQTLPRQRAILAELDGKPTDPDGAKLAAHARAVFDSQSAAYKADPWDAAARFQRLPSVPPVQITNGAQLLQIAQQRVPLMNQVEAASGAPAPLLRPEELPGAINALNAMPPAGRAEVLGRIGTSMSLERVAAFADQLDKGDKPLALTLKLGTDGTTAGRLVSELVQRGAQALKDKTVKKDETALTGWRSEIAGLVRGTLGDPRAESDVIEAAYYVRAAMDQDGIGVEGFKLDASARQAVKLVAGIPVERNGTRTLLPRGMEEAAFDTELQAMSAPKIMQGIAPDGVVYLRGQPVPLERFSANVLRYGLARDGQGNYLPSSGGAFVTLDKAGTQPLRLPVKP